MSLDKPLSDSLPTPTTDTSSVIPPLGEQGTPTLGMARRPLFATDTTHRIARTQPTPPTGPPPTSASSAAASRTPPPLADILEMRLPGINAQGVGAGPALENCEVLVSATNFSDSREKIEVSENKGDSKTGVSRRIARPPSMLSALPESGEAESIQQTGLDGLKGTWSGLPEGGVRNRAEPGLSVEIELAARKAQRVAEVRNIAQEVARVGDHDGNTAADDAERGEIERALAAVDETRRKRMERQQAELGGAQQDEEKLRRRQAKRDQLMKKRKDMEERLEEEGSKMAELTESAKKKGESKFMSEEAKRDAEERIRAEGEVVAELERQAAEMALQRENMQKQLAKQEVQKAAEVKANSSALKTKRALLEARMKQEEEEIKSLSEAAKREVEAKMVAEAAAIADMERQALEMSAKRAELEAEMSNKLRQEDTMVHEAQQISQKREAMEAKIQKEEAELQKLSDEAKHRVLEKMAAEATAIADMEKEANELALEREALAFRLASQRSFANHEDGFSEAGGPPVDAGWESSSQLTRSGKASNCTALEHDALSSGVTCIASTLSGDTVGEEANDKTVQSAPDSVNYELCRDGGVTETDEHAVVFIPSVVKIDGNLQNDEHDTDLSNSNVETIEETQWGSQNIFIAQPSILNTCTHCRKHQRDMTPAHLSAAAGHLACLEAIQLGHSELLRKIDSAGRSPLFYACTNAHADAADFLIRESPQYCHATDVNRDTPLHAAALAGSGLCCRLLLQQERVEVDPLNAMHMTPGHLAANHDVLEVLSQHGANLNAKDADLRTPLFAACATDRLEKAEFLCELLECAGQDLGEADKRGDTPMHAAAYNGSTACLLLLLQYGVAPDVRNTKGLRPIDLASRKGQSACEKILMEYQLHHHVNNSYFDSVLFLATLELPIPEHLHEQGHKKCKEGLTDGSGNGNTATESQAASPLVRPESLWSLRRGRSVRLEHWGDWIAYEDQNAQSVFWYNHVAQKTQWDAPTEIGEASTNHFANSSMRLKREGDWIEYTLPDGNVFYYNDKNNEFQWERPHQLSSIMVSEEWAEEEGLKDSTTATATSGDWAAFEDPSTGLVFWYNQVTGESQWEPPEDLGAAVEAQGGKAGRIDGDLMALEEEVREITCVDDLFTPR